MTLYELRKRFEKTIEDGISYPLDEFKKKVEKQLQKNAKRIKNDNLKIMKSTQQQNTGEKKHESS